MDAAEDGRSLMTRAFKVCAGNGGRANMGLEHGAAKRN